MQFRAFKINDHDNQVGFLREVPNEHHTSWVNVLLACGHYSGNLHPASSSFDFPEDGDYCKTCEDFRPFHMQDGVGVFHGLKLETIEKVVSRCGAHVIGDGIQCPHCKAMETYKDAGDPANTDRWYFTISAYKVDDHSHCSNCDQWFGDF